MAPTRARFSQKSQGSRSPVSNNPSCFSGGRAGVAIKRVAFDTTDLTSKALLAAQQGNSPDVLIVDNPVVSTLADAGVLSTTDETKTDTSAVQPNLLAAGQLGIVELGLNGEE